MIKKIVGYIKESPGMLFVILTVAAVIIALVLPLLILLGRIFWTFAFLPVTQVV